MNRMFVVASTEFLMLIKTKAFIIGLLMMPVMVGASIAFQVFAAKQVDKDDHRFAVIDHTGVLYEPLAKAAAEHNAKLGDGDARTGPHFQPSLIDLGGRRGEDVRFDLSELVRHKDLFAFVEIPDNVLDLDAPKDGVIDYFTETPSYNTLPDWIETVLNHEIASRRFAKAAVDQGLVAKLTRQTNVSTLGLVERNANGTMREATKVNPVQTYVLPFGMMYLLFIALMSSAPPLLNAVIEEKMSKISEVLIASVSPFQLMMGKLIGVAAVAAFLAMVYCGGGMYAAFSTGHWEFIQPALLCWFVVFLLCAVLMFGSVFIAIGSACTDLKDAQSMMQPAMLVLVAPMLVAPMILHYPNSPFAVGISLVPIWTPFIMLLRLAMTPGPPLWQIALSIVLTLGATALFVWAAGRIFRVGLLMQGKAPNLPEMIRWIRQ